ncbi:hypothetical protein N7507_007042 [Penicillium longicatenatum]|nr:hypothetical protein N7507_007042 [Penicillium longicatenatum]
MVPINVWPSEDQVSRATVPTGSCEKLREDGPTEYYGEIYRVVKEAVGRGAEKKRSQFLDWTRLR